LPGLKPWLRERRSPRERSPRARSPGEVEGAEINAYL